MNNKDKNVNYYQKVQDKLGVRMKNLEKGVNEVYNKRKKAQAPYESKISAVKNDKTPHKSSHFSPYKRNPSFNKKIYESDLLQQETKQAYSEYKQAYTKTNDLVNKVKPQSEQYADQLDRQDLKIKNGRVIVQKDDPEMLSVDYYSESTKDSENLKLRSSERAETSAYHTLSDNNKLDIIEEKDHRDENDNPMNYNIDYKKRVSVRLTRTSASGIYNKDKIAFLENQIKTEQEKKTSKISANLQNKVEKSKKYNVHLHHAEIEQAKLKTIKEKNSLGNKGSV